MFIKLWNWLKKLFTNWYNKEQWNIKDIENAFENLLSQIDKDKSGLISLKEITETLRDILNKLKRTKK